MKPSTKSVNIIGCGWLGSALGNSLSSNGYTVYGSTTSEEKFDTLRSLDIIPYKLQLGNHSDETSGSFPDASTYIILLSPRILHTSFRELTSLLSAGDSQDIIMASSTAVYPNINGIVFEKDAIHQRSPHSGVDLLDLEEKVSAVRPSAILRFAGLYGPGRHPGKFFENRKRPSGGNNPVNLVHQADCLRAIEVILKEGDKGTYNICADQHPEKKQFYSAACSDLGMEIPAFDETPAPFKIVSNKLFREKFNFTYSHPDPMADFS